MIMVRSYLDLSINERINLKSWYPNLPLAYFFKNKTLKKDVDKMFSDEYIGGKTAQTKMESPRDGTFFFGFSKQPEDFKKLWVIFVTHG